jgi:hypothetical protein
MPTTAEIVKPNVHNRNVSVPEWIAVKLAMMVMAKNINSREKMQRQVQNVRSDSQTPLPSNMALSSVLVSFTH